MKRRNLTTLVAVLLIAGSLACNLPFISAAPSAPTSAAPTESGFAVPTPEGQVDAPPVAGETAPPPAADNPPAANNAPANSEITLATTPALANTDLFKQWIADFQTRTGYTVRVEADAPGRGFRLAEKFIVDVLLVNDPGSEKDFIAKGLGRDRIALFHTDYVLLGPADDPAKVKGSPNVAEAFKKIATAQAKFVTSVSETPAKALEGRIWKQIGVTPAGEWYTTSEEGPKGVIKIAADRKAYILAPRELYLDVKSKTPDLKLEVLFEGEGVLFDVYHLVTVNPDKSPKVNYTGAQALVQYLTSPTVSEQIAAYGTAQYGEPVFFVK